MIFQSCSRIALLLQPQAENVDEFDHLELFFASLIDVFFSHKSKKIIH